jgi:hypothetical protein
VPLNQIASGDLTPVQNALQFFDDAGTTMMTYLKKGINIFTPDVDSHSGRVWKMADSVENFSVKKTRTGTYDANLNRSGD